MRIKLCPVAALPYDQKRLVLIKSAGNHLSINGEIFNFNPLNPGDYIEHGSIPTEHINGRVEHVDGHVTVPLIYPIGDNAEHFQRFPEPITVEDDGPIDIPVDTIVEVSETANETGTTVTTTIRRWHQPDEVSSKFIPAPPPEPQEEEEAHAHVEP